MKRRLDRIPSVSYFMIPRRWTPEIARARRRKVVNAHICEIAERRRGWGLEGGLRAALALRYWAGCYRKMPPPIVQEIGVQAAHTAAR